MGGAATALRLQALPLTCNPKLVALPHHHGDGLDVAAATDDGMHIRGTLSKPVAQSKVFDALIQLLAVSFHQQVASELLRVLLGWVAPRNVVDPRQVGHAAVDAQQLEALCLRLKGY